MTDIYRELQQFLDKMPTGFPETQSGVEIKILKRLFTEKEAEIFLKMGNKKVFSGQAGTFLDMEENEASEAIETMAKKGLLLRIKKGTDIFYKTVPYVMGIFEYQVGSMTPELARDMEDFYHEAFGKTLLSYNTPAVRTIPVNTRIANKWPISPYEDVVKIIEQQDRIALANCVCRTVKHNIGKGCDKPVETCIIFGSHGDYYIENNMGRRIDVKEALEVLKNCEEKGLVVQTANAQRPGLICCCCGCCCDMLRSLKMQPKPVSAVNSNYNAAVEDDFCTGCEVCMERCQMDAVSMEEGIALIDLDRCIGCGLCITTCPVEAVSLIKKEENEQYVPPESGIGAFLEIAKERGLL